MDLAAHQRKLLGLFRSTYEVAPDDDAYIQSVAQSKDLEEGRRNIFLWRVFVLERTTALTCGLLRRRGLFETTLNDFISGHNISPFRETQGPDFLEALSGHADDLVASVAQFELALMKVRQGDPATYEVSWSVEPHSVLNSLARDLPLEETAVEGDYRVIVSGRLPHQFEIVSVCTPDSASSCA